MHEEEVEAAARLLASARRAVAFTGAGISTESGIPDFRGPRGLWKSFDPMKIAHIGTFKRDPRAFWEFAASRNLSGAKPNAGHLALAELERAGLLRAVVTQNVDGLHQAAGSRRVIEIHGNGGRLRCLRCGALRPFSADLLEPGPVPLCPSCSRPLKPDVVLFGEDVRDLDAATELLAGCDLLLVVGTSAEVVPAAWLPGEVLDRGGSLIEFNLEPTRLTRAGLGPRGAFVEGPVATTLPLVASRVLAA